MSLKTLLQLLLACAALVPHLAVDVANCTFEDTVDLTNAQKFPNGSYLYDKSIIPADLVGLYDYEEINNGVRLPRAPHPRGCICRGRSCIRFCCHPTKELIANASRKCSGAELDAELEYDPYVNVVLANGTAVRRHVTQEFTVVQGVPCEGAYHLVPQQFEEDQWDLFFLIMSLKTLLQLLLACAALVPHLAVDVANCTFEDTVDLTNAQKFPNGSYLYDKSIIPADLVGLYDYEEINNGVRLPRAPHPRGCICRGRSCIRFCCHPTKELIANASRKCSGAELDAELEYDPYVNVVLANGTAVRRHVTQEFTVVQGVPCEGAYHLVPQQFEEDQWDLFENGTLLRHYDEALLSKRDYCFMPIELDTGEWVLNPMNCPIMDHGSISIQINNIAMAISVPFIILTVLVYGLIPELRNLHGKCLTSYLTPLAIGYTILSTISLTDVVFPNWLCSSMGYVGYYCFMSAFFWLSVISFDLWQNFRLTGSIRFGQRKRFAMYSAYAWGIPACLTLIVIAIQNSNMDDLYKPGIGDDFCWLKTYDWSAMIYFFGINLVIVLIDITFFSMTYYKITVMQRDIDKIIRNDTNEGRHKLRTHKNNFGLFLRLFLIMGVSWLLDIASYIETLLHPGVVNPIYYVSDFMNAIQGLLIFVCFVLKPKVLSLIKKRLFGKQDETDNYTQSECEEEEISLNGIGTGSSQRREELT